MTENKEILDIQKAVFSEKQSAIAKYQNLMIGRSDIWSLIKYEFIQMFITPFPGALGIFLRRIFYPCFLGSVGKNVAFGSHVTIRHPHKIHLGDNVVIDDYCVLDAKGESNDGIRVGSGVFIGRNTIVHCKNGSIKIGDQANIGFNCDISASGNVEIGDKVFIAAYAYIVGGGHDFSLDDVSVMDQGRTARGIRIGNGSWIGAGAIILDGVEIGSDAIIGAGAVVTKAVSDQAIAVGMPAQVVRHRSGNIPAKES